jgi:putative oxidoreductase
VFTLRPALALAVLRVVVGFVFLMHGYQKFFTNGIAGVTGFFASLGIPLASVAAPSVATVELVGGALVILGFQHRIAAALQTCVVLGAIGFAKMGGGFFAPGGIELELTLAAGAFTIALAGGGAMTLEDALKKG